jgi:hypothetical protein
MLDAWLARRWGFPLRMSTARDGFAFSVSIARSLFESEYLDGAWSASFN